MVDMRQHFSVPMLLRFVAPSVAMMVFTSIYSVVDGLFVTNFVGKTAFAAVNLIMPFIMILGTLGFMMGAGGSALVAKTRGEGDDARANAYFSMIVYVTLGAGALLALVGFAFMEDVARLLGANGDMLPVCVLYGRISMLSLPLFMLQYTFQVLASTAGKPKVGLYTTLASGLSNMVLDFVFVAVLGWGVAGAAAATVIAEYVGGLAPLFYFARRNESYLKLGRPALYLRALGKTCANGSSEMMTSIAMSVVSVVYNLQLMAFLGKDGVAAYGVIMYAFMIFAAIFEGYCMGCAPLMSYQHGARNTSEMRSLLAKSLRVVACGGIVMFALAELLAAPLAQIFTGYDAGLFALTVHAFRVYAFALCFMGISMYGSSLFTALGNGLVSALIAFLRTLVFEVGAVLLLPLVMGADGIWYSVIVAELVSFALTIVLLFWLSPYYGLRDKKHVSERA
ncbi:MAG: MATE family efflux transporter [Coriobacteriales bacterium]|nr:MATE family efflux transporter [Coriobacteriales bacterium]